MEMNVSRSNDELGEMLLTSIRDGASFEGASPNYWRPSDTWSSLHMASHVGRDDLIKVLIQYGAHVNQRAVDMASPLHIAALRKQTQCIHTLLDAGAEVNARNIDGSTPLCDAAAVGSLECLKLLVKRGAVVNPPIVESPPLYEACLSGNVACVAFLIECGVDMTAGDRHHGSALHAACSKGYASIVKVLLEYGADPNASRLYTRPLHVACAQGNLRCIKLLAYYGANPMHEDWRGRNAFDACTNQSCLDFLRNFTSKPRTLMDLCCLFLRRIFGANVIRLSSDLNIPRTLQVFLRYGPGE